MRNTKNGEWTEYKQTADFYQNLIPSFWFWTTPFSTQGLLLVWSSGVTHDGAQELKLVGHVQGKYFMCEALEENI